VMASRTRYLSQYFRYVRRGALRIASKANLDDVRTAAFINPNGRIAVVVHTKGSGTIEVRGLAVGRYAATITTRDRTGLELGEHSTTPLGALVIQSPGEGVLTVYRE